MSLKLTFNPFTSNFDFIQNLANVTEDIIFGSDVTYNIGSAAKVALGVYTRNIYGGDAAADSLNLFANNVTWDYNNSGKITINNLVDIVAPTTVVGMTGNPNFGLISTSQTIASTGESSFYINGVRFSHVITYNTAQGIFGLSQSQGFSNQVKVRMTTAVTDAIISTSFGGFIDQGAWEVGYNGSGGVGWLYASYGAYPTFQRGGGATGTGTLTNGIGFFSGPTVGAGITVTTFRHFWVNDISNAGTVTTHTGLYIPNLTIGTNIYGIHSEMNSASNKYLIAHTGTAGSLLGGFLWMISDGTGDGSIRFGAGGSGFADSSIYSDGTHMVIDATLQTVNADVGIIAHALNVQGDIIADAGGSSSNVTIGGALTEFFTDTTVGGAEADIYSYTTPASLLATNGDKIIASYSGNFVTVGTELTQLKVYFAGTAIWDSTGVAPTTGTTSWRVFVEIIRVSATVVRYSVSLNTTAGSTYVYSTVGELTGLTLTNTNILKITGTSSGVGSGSGDIVGKLGYVNWLPDN